MKGPISTWEEEIPAVGFLFPLYHNLITCGMVSAASFILWVAPELFHLVEGALGIPWITCSVVALHELFGSWQSVPL